MVSPRCPTPQPSGALRVGHAFRRYKVLAGLLQPLACVTCCAACATTVPPTASCRALTTLTSVDLHCEPLPAELAAALASLPQLQSARLQGWEPPADDSGAWQQLAALGSRLRGLHFVLGDAAANEDVPAVLPPGLLALTAAGSIALDIYPGWDEQQPGLPGLDRLPGVDSVTMWHTFNPPEVWRCSNLRSLEFHNATAGVALPHDAQPAAHLTQLTSLSLVYACFDGGRLPPPLCSLPRLQALRVDHCGFSELQLPLQASLLTALRQLSLGRLTLSTDSCAALASIPALTKLRFSGELDWAGLAWCLLAAAQPARLPGPRRCNPPALLARLPAECTLADLPSGPYQSALRELSLIGSSQVAGQELPPPSISGASQLTALHCSLHTFSPETLRTQWPVFLATLQALPNLEVRGGAQALQKPCGRKGWPVALLWVPASGASLCSPAGKLGRLPHTDTPTPPPASAVRQRIRRA